MKVFILSSIRHKVKANPHTFYSMYEYTRDSNSLSTEQYIKISLWLFDMCTASCQTNFSHRWITLYILSFYQYIVLYRHTYTHNLYIKYKISSLGSLYTHNPVYNPKVLLILLLKSLISFAKFKNLAQKKKKKNK